ncbi:MAG: response regulator transcription factor [Thermoguttaceae bacterium]|nr:response regulator transcription factor [Planctomycetaceae bacterium]MBQ4142263.1 response regulator transcription factor [Thermoguttaceae bacterium]
MEIRLLHVDDRDITRAGIRSLLADSVLHLIGSAASAEEAFRFMTDRHPDILLLNIQAASFDGVDFLRKFRRQFPGTKVIVLTSANDPYHICQAAELGVKDYVLENIAAMDLVLLIQNVYYGTGTSSNPAWNQVLKMQADPQFQEQRQKLTHREEQVLRCIVQGKSNKEIAVHLNVSAETVKEHIQHIFRKLGVHARTEAAVWAIRNGMA